MGAVNYTKNLLKKILIFIRFTSSEFQSWPPYESESAPVAKRNLLCRPVGRHEDIRDFAEWIEVLEFKWLTISRISFAICDLVKQIKSGNYLDNFLHSWWRKKSSLWSLSYVGSFSEDNAPILRSSIQRHVLWVLCGSRVRKVSLALMNDRK